MSQTQERVNYRGWTIERKPAHSYGYQVNEFNFRVLDPFGTPVGCNFRSIDSAKFEIDGKIENIETAR